MEFGGHVITLNLDVVSSIAIKKSTTSKSRGKTMIVYQETAIYGLLTRSAALILIVPWELEGQ
jgi:hypothetical protein